MTRPAPSRVSPQSWSVSIGAGQSGDFRNFIARVAASGALPATAFDRLCGRFTPAFNNLARLLFYRLGHVRSSSRCFPGPWEWIGRYFVFRETKVGFVREAGQG